MLMGCQAAWGQLVLRLCPRVSGGREVLSTGRSLACESETWRLQVKVLKAQVHSSTQSTKPLAFEGKTDFYLKNKLEFLGEKRRAVWDPTQRRVKDRSSTS